MEVHGQRFSMQKPTEWDGLIQIARDSLAATDTPDAATPESIGPVYDAVSTLSNDTLDSNRFYGLGIMMCSTGKVLRDEALRDQVVQESVRKITSWYRGDRADGAGMRPTHVGAAFLGMSFMNPLREISDQDPTEQTIVQDSLQRAFQRRISSITPSEDEDDEFSHANLRRQAVQDIVEGHVMSDTVARNTASAALNTLFRAYRQHVPVREVEAGTTFDPAYHEDPIDVETFKSLDVTRLATGLARLRRDEFVSQDYLGEMLETDEDGTVRLPRSNVPVSPPPVGHIEMPDFSSPLLHEDRLGCPALHVQKLIPLVLEFVPEVIEKAAERIDAFESTGNQFVL